MIINTGNRTDIPAFFSEWFYNRINEGFVCVRNPYYPSQVSRYILNPDVVDCIAFCTKNPQPMLDRLSELDAYRQFWFVTITPYGRDIEPYVPEKERVMDSFCRLSEKNGVRRMGWRYDPIFISPKYDLDFHIRTFEKMAGRLNGAVDQVTISFIDLYEKTKRNFPEAREVSVSDQIVIAKEFVRIGEKYGMKLRSCHEGDFLEKYGIDISGCMNQAVLERAIGGELHVPKRPSAREGCSCLLGADIGAYNTCGHGCLYCYANYDRELVEMNMRLHDPASPFLIAMRPEGGFSKGSCRWNGSMPDDEVHDAKQISWYDGQMHLKLE